VSALRFVAALLAGLVLAAVPFLRYAHVGTDSVPHADHEPHHGGILGMAGDHHVELCHRAGRVEVFVSDAFRRPVRPHDGRVVADGERVVALAWRNHRLEGPDVPGAARMDVAVALADGETRTITFDVSPGPASRVDRPRPRG
jgi:hypothetical protein